MPVQFPIFFFELRMLVFDIELERLRHIFPFCRKCGFRMPHKFFQKMILHDKTMNNIKEHVQHIANMQEKLHLGHSLTKTIARDRTMSSLDQNVQKIVKWRKNMHYE